ncbi:MAG: Glyoxalase/bleomycin resistance protein/dioxygenase [Polaromonas sp.]|nr:Glyoxalase/bleomycin resistance protein/dioxygenase [Polaromonas sp.]
MIGYVTLGVSDVARAGVFYDALLAEIGAHRIWDFEQPISWGGSPEKPTLAVIKPYDGKAATAGNGVMGALVVDSPETVDRVHRKALELGGQDEGLLEQRALIYERARQENPQRWSGQARQWTHVDAVHLNPDTLPIKEPQRTQKLA